MEKRLLLAVLLITCVMVITNVLFPPPPAVEEDAGSAADSLVATPAITAPAAAAPTITAPPATADTVFAVSERFRYGFSTRGASLVLAELAVQCGCADQPHLAREWRALTGVNITTWVREELPFVQDAAPAGDAHSLP